VDREGSQAAAFERLYAAYRSRVYGFLYRMAGTRDAADDLFQDTWLKVARSWDRRGNAEIADQEAWLFTVARNVFLSERRATAAKTRATHELELVPPSGGGSPERLAATREAGAALEAALDELSDDDRAVLWLAAVEGLHQRQIAQVLGIGYAAARQRLARARERLSQRMARATLNESHEANQP
jgi:RNA polymerase sigma-70 factor (ECF subfamily)